MRGKEEGQSLIELLLVIAIVTIIVSSVTGAIIITLRTNLESVSFRIASALGEEMVDSVKSIAEGRWSNLYGVGSKGPSTTYRVASSGTLLIVQNGTENVTANSIVYTRSFSVENVNRDSNGNIVITGGTEDPSTQKITANVRWMIIGKTAEMKLVEYLTRFRNEVTIFGDWSGGGGQAGPITVPNNSYFNSANLTVVDPETLQLVGGQKSGNLEGSTFDTEAVNGMIINSIMWLGTAGGSGSTVRFKIASSPCSNGASDPPTCNSNQGWGGSKTSGDGAFVGSDGSSATYYSTSGPGSPASVPAAHHSSKRYFRYQIYLDRPIGSIATPVIDDIVINWSP